MACSICYCEVEFKDQVLCGDGHIFCGACTISWFETLDVSMLKGRCNSTGVRCPHIDSDQCRSIIQLDEASIVCKDDGCVDRLSEKCKRASKYFVEDALESLSIRCPRMSCGVMLDLNPDACAAIVCGNCGQNFCSCCHCKFATSQQTHLHVPLAHNWRDVFLPRNIVLAGQKRLRMKQLRCFLDRVQVSALVDEFFVLAYSELTDLDIPTTWTDFCEASDAARLLLDQQASNMTVNHGELVGNTEERPHQLEEDVSPEVLLGRQILSLCFDTRFDELQVLYHECRRTNRLYDVDWLQRSPDGNTAFNVAARVGGDGFYRVACMELVISLGGGVAINELDSDGFSALHRFVLLNDAQCMKFLLNQEGVNVEVETPEGRTALFLCAESRHIHLARDLLRQQAYLHTTCDTGQNVLMALSMRCLLDHVMPGELVRNLKFWMDAGVDLEVPDGQSAWRVLHYAACGRFDSGAVAIQTLLRGGAQVNSRNRFKQTPLQVAVCFGNLEGIRALVAAEGSDPSIPFDSEEPLLLNADHERRRGEIVAVLKQAQAWERRKIALMASVRSVWKEYGGYVGVAVGMSMIAVLFKPMQSFFARFR